MKANRYILFVLVCLTMLTACVNRQTKQQEAVSSGTGLKFADTTKMQPGLTILDRVSEGQWTCTLIDAQGNILKQYPYSLVKPFDDGTYLAKKDSLLVKLDSALNIIWQTEVKTEPHHEITTDEAGNIYTFSACVHPFMGLPVKFDGVQMFSSEGKLLRSWCVYDHLKEFVSILSQTAWTKNLPHTLQQTKSIEEYILQSPETFIAPTTASCNCDFEFTHFNALEVLPENAIAAKIPAFKKGNLLLSFNPYASYGILNIITGKIEWVGYLPERTRLHSTSFTPQGTVLVFQNSTDSTSWFYKGGYDTLRTFFQQKFTAKTTAPPPPSRAWTSITEYNPLTNQKGWEYTATPKESLRVNSRGSVQQLPNGNRLLCTTTEQAGGRVFEITPNKKIVWDYAYPENAPDKGKPWSFYRARRLSTAISNRLLQQINSKNKGH